MPTQHWLVSVARAAGLAETSALELARGVPVPEAWRATARALGIGEDTLATYVAAHHGLKVADLGAAVPPAAKLLPPSVVRGYDVFPLRQDDRCLYVAITDPTNLDADRAVGFASGRTPVFEVAPPGPLRELIADRYSPDQATAPADVTAAEVESGPLIKLSNLIFRDAIRHGASDIHVQPGVAGGVVRFRVDGVLRQYTWGRRAGG